MPHNPKKPETKSQTMFNAPKPNPKVPKAGSKTSGKGPSATDIIQLGLELIGGIGLNETSLKPLRKRGVKKGGKR